MIEDQKRAFCNLIKNYSVAFEGKYPFDVRFPTLDGIPDDTLKSDLLTENEIYQILEESKEDGVSQVFSEKRDPVVEECCRKLGLKYVVDAAQVKYQQEWMKENRECVENA